MCGMHQEKPGAHRGVWSLIFCRNLISADFPPTISSVSWPCDTQLLSRALHQHMDLKVLKTRIDSKILYISFKSLREPNRKALAVSNYKGNESLTITQWLLKHCYISWGWLILKETNLKECGSSDKIHIPNCKWLPCFYYSHYDSQNTIFFLVL